MPTDHLYLTELILCIQHEVQSAVDFIAEQARSPTELGQSSAVMAVETLRVRLPFDTEVIQATHKVPQALHTAPGAGQIQAALAQRKGLMLDNGKPGGMATFLKLKVHPDNAAPSGASATTSATTARAEIEITFSPIQRPQPGA
jgi:hypothetical protein